MSEASNGWGEATIERNPLVAEQLRKFQEDYLWCLNQVDLRERYANQVVILHDRKVIGSGESSAQAREAARQALAAQGTAFPSESEIHILIVPPMAWVE
jgi:hypothetical protein